MTRRKWQRLRRKHPSIFGDYPAWEALSANDRAAIKHETKAEIVRVLTAHRVRIALER